MLLILLIDYLILTDEMSSENNESFYMNTLIEKCLSGENEFKS